jgi:thymidine kinase
MNSAHKDDLNPIEILHPDVKRITPELTDTKSDLSATNDKSDLSFVSDDCGYLELILGNMYSGKTTYITTLRVPEIADCLNIRPLLISNKLDTRNINSDRGITSHSSQFKGLSDKIDVHLTSSLRDSMETMMKYEYIGIDEFTLFGLGSAAPIIELVKKFHKKIFVAALSGNSEMGLFGEVHLLIPNADNIIFKRAVCHDHMVEMKLRGIATQQFNLPRGSFSYKLTPSIEEIDVGGKDKYISVCRYHYNKRKNEQISAKLPSLQNEVSEKKS